MLYSDIIPGNLASRIKTGSEKLHWQTLGNRCDCHWSSEMTIINGCHVSQ